jgi:PIN domain nuclease of toxin-antitoxin system
VILLDTHVAVWYGAGIELKPRTIRMISEAAEQNAVILSAISAWEIGMLVAERRLLIEGTAESYVRYLFSRSGVVEEPMTSAIGELAARLPGVFHGDAADRILVATAALRSISLLTRDKRIQSYARRSRFITVVTV